MRSTRNCGRQSRSRHTTSRLGRCWVITTAIESMKPRTALTGRPSGAVIDDGTPKYDRNHMLAPSSSTSGDRMRAILPAMDSFEAAVYARRLEAAAAATAHAGLAGLVITPGYD